MTQLRAPTILQYRFKNSGVISEHLVVDAYILCLRSSLQAYLARFPAPQFINNSRLITSDKSSRNMSSPSTVQIRPIRASDKETWKNLWGQYNVFYKRTVPDNVTEATFDRFLDPQNPISCAVATKGADSQPIGFATYYPHPSTASIDPNFYLHDLFVDPSSRAAGTGEKLIDYVADKAREAGAYQLYWHTQVSHLCSWPESSLLTKMQYFNYRAQGLYAKVGERSDLVLWKKGL